MREVVGRARRRGVRRGRRWRCMFGMGGGVVLVVSLWDIGSSPEEEWESREC